MIVQACLNGARPRDYHPRLPMTPDAMAADGAACVLAGAAELHIHPRGPDGRESLEAIDDTMRVVRRACPGTLIGVSTGAWIEGDVERTRDCISRWRVLPDYASVNLSEPDAPAVIALLHQMGVGVEAGLATVADAERLASLADRHRVFRVLIEIEAQDPAGADAVADGIARVLARADIVRPILLHGFDDTVWHFVARAHQKRWSTRVGLEDGRLLVNGEQASGNTELVAEAAALYRRNAA
ncbi:3-keto-5-aminohexanoate cleavage protein [Shinella oryzae]|uniref:3-keto-5-aminohexanoate cleavage protein n=1 Tax=Shinella oryzae TaxID=2871820 RepID=A0ABY9KBJ7_9HYPH|nr:3-keto-5-aminohexanoate cleavage protein [Shinella oryzae]WLS04131.1 3-keto-5-aminohexanoate cleavage protein [Shinella oryzae]